MVLSAMFSAAETAIQSLSAARVRFLSEQGKTAKLLKLWPKQRLRVLTTILIGNNLVNITATALATDFVHTQIGGGWALSAAIGVMTFLILTFGEIVPKSYAIGSAETYVKWALPLLTPFYWFTLPFTIVMTKLTRVVIGAFGGSPVFKTHPLTEEEFRFLLAQGSNLDARKGEMLSSIFEFHESMVKEIMIPRTDVKALDVDADNAQLLQAIADDMFSRYPVYEDNIDNIIGVFNVKDLLQYLNEHELDSFKLRKFLRRPYFVPETKKISELFRELQRRKFHIAIAVDEFGGTAGIVTMEDIIEEIFGEIYDEF
ncbi:MAG: HlyC/CorC family transporter, partial [Myxococcales bacterium]|nr:HlyC/CorC family transporter [Myxococcales bacterium]